MQKPYDYVTYSLLRLKRSKQNSILLVKNNRNSHFNTKLRPRDEAVRY